MVSSADYCLPVLSKLRANPELGLWVPAVENSIQFGTIRPQQFQELTLAFDSATLAIKWRNKEPLGIDEVIKDDLLNETRRSMLVRPVAQFSLHKSNIVDWWRLSEGKEEVIGGSESLTGFFELIASCAVVKQAKIHALAEQQRINLLLREFDDEDVGSAVL